MKCDGCQLESDREDIFKRHARTFGDDLSLCPDCFQKRNDKINIFLIWMYSIFGILALPAVFYPPANVLGLLLLDIAVFQLLLLTSTILHELGHAFAGKVCGMRVFSIEIGKGRAVYEFLFWGIRWRIRVIAFGGITYATSFSTRFFRIRQFVYVLGGPLANAIILFISIKLLPLDETFKPTIFNGFVPFLLLALGNVLLLLYSLVPHVMNSIAGKIPNDGLWLVWKVWRIKKEDIAKNLAARYLYEAHECCLRKDLAGAQKWIDEGIKLFPGNFYLKTSAAGMLYLQKKYSEALRAYALLVGRYKKLKDADSLLLNNIAYACLLINKPELLPRADAASRLALKQMPWMIQFKGTRGSVLVELGRYDEALPLLHAAMRNHPEKSSQALNACYIGIAESRRGNLAERRSYFAIARKLDPDCVLLERDPPFQSNGAA